MNNIEQEFQEWLREHKAYITVAVKTPQGEYIKPENFIPQGWTVVIGVQRGKETNATIQTEEVRKAQE